MALTFETLYDPSAREKLSRAIEHSYNEGEPRRQRRKQLIEIYRGESELDAWLTDKESDTLLNLFQSYVRGHLLSVAHQLPTFTVEAKTRAAIQFEKVSNLFLKRYSELLDLDKVFWECAIDSAFGNACVKVCDGPPPRGVYSYVAPRAYRISPDHLIVDHSANSPEEGSYIADVYLVSLREAQTYEHFNPEVRSRLQPWRDSAQESMLPDHVSNVDDILAEDMTRLIDVYFPAQGILVTWPADSSGDKFTEVASSDPLMINRVPTNPYIILQMLKVPDSAEEISHLSALRGLHLLANDMLHKAATQARQSKRNPTGRLGEEQDLDTLLNKGEGEGVLLEDDSELDIFALPGPDPSIVSMASYATGLFSQYSGNLDVALGHSAGADTARQTEALMGQIGNNQALDRVRFEKFMSDVGKALLTYAFESEVLALEMMDTIPGTNYSYPVTWAPEDQLPRPASIDEYHLSVVPHSASYRPPEARIGQLEQASRGILQWMMAAAQGVPVNIPAIIESYSEAFDLVGDLAEWFSPQEPSNAQKVASKYVTDPSVHNGTQVQYQGGLGGGGGGGGAGPPEPSPGGFQNG